MSKSAQKRNFVVAAWEKCRARQRDLREVRATSHEEAVALVAASRVATRDGVVYEAWPAKQPGCSLRITLEPRTRHLSSPPLGL